MPFEELKKALTEQITNLRSAPAPEEPVEFDAVYLDGTEPDNSKWLALIRERVKTAKSFEIHCWNEETEWIELALKYGTLKEDDWQHGKITTGSVTPEFIDMLLNMPKPADRDIYNQMTPFFKCSWMTPSKAAITERKYISNKQTKD